MSHLSVWSGSFLVIVVAGCGSEGSAGGGARPAVAIDRFNFGGRVDLRVTSDSHSLDARFISAANTDAPDSVFKIEATDECVNLNTLPPGFFADYTYRDVGEEVTAASEFSTIHAPKGVQVSGAITYEFIDGNSTAESDADYVLSVEGGGGLGAGEVVGTIPVPKLVSVTDRGDYIPSDPWDIKFTADAGAIVVRFRLDGIDSFHCYAKPDGSFTVPGDVTFDLGSGADITDIEAYAATSVTILGREMLLVGRASE